MTDSLEGVPAATISTQSPLAQVRGLGSAREGGQHWGLERLSAAAVLALFVWLGVSLMRLPALDYPTITAWLRTPLAAVPMLLLVVSTFWHLKMGLIVVVEDYVHEEGSKLVWLMLIRFAAIFAGTMAVFSVLKIALGAATGGPAG
jgi:succinate dehydrogenase / fumarate reductase membrane anchor subunit